MRLRNVHNTTANPSEAFITKYRLCKLQNAKDDRLIKFHTQALKTFPFLQQYSTPKRLKYALLQHNSTPSGQNTFSYSITAHPTSQNMRPLTAR